MHQTYVLQMHAYVPLGKITAVSTNINAHKHVYVTHIHILAFVHKHTHDMTSHTNKKINSLSSYRVHRRWVGI